MDPLEHPAWFDEILHWLSLGTEAAGVAVIVVGAIAASAVALRVYLRGEEGGSGAVRISRIHLARSILFGLEFLIASDIIGTVAVRPTYTSLGVLAGIILIRVGLGFLLELETEGRWPWQAPKRE